MDIATVDCRGYPSPALRSAYAARAGPAARLLPGRPFPHISNLSLNLAVMVRGPEGDRHIARVKVPTSLPRFVPVEPGRRLIWLEEVIAGNLGALFPGYEIVETYSFQVIRDADMEIQEDEAPVLLGTIEQGLRQRQFGPVVRLAVDEAMPEPMVDTGSMVGGFVSVCFVLLVPDR